MELNFTDEEVMPFREVSDVEGDNISVALMILGDDDDADDVLLLSLVEVVL